MSSKIISEELVKKIVRLYINDNFSTFSSVACYCEVSLSTVTKAIHNAISDSIVSDKEAEAVKKKVYSNVEKRIGFVSPSVRSFYDGLFELRKNNEFLILKETYSAELLKLNSKLDSLQFLIENLELEERDGPTKQDLDKEIFYTQRKIEEYEELLKNLVA